MKNKKTLLFLLLSFALLMGGAYVLYDRLGQDAAPDRLAVQQPPEEQPAPEEPDTSPSASGQDSAKIPAPDFTVYNAQGDPVRLSDYFGKPIVMNFWASWCGPCKMEMPDFQTKYLELGEEVHFLMINMTTGRETKEDADALIAAEGYTFPILYDTDAEAAMTYGVYSLPTTLFIDGEGCAIAQATGAIDASILQQGIDMIR